MGAAGMMHCLIFTELSRMFKAGGDLIDHCLVKDALAGCGS